MIEGTRVSVQDNLRVGEAQNIYTGVPTVMDRHADDTVKVMDRHLETQEYLLTPSLDCVESEFVKSKTGDDEGTDASEVWLMELSSPLVRC